MLWSLGSCSDKGKVDIGCGSCGQLLLCLLSCFLQSLESHLVIGQIHALSFLELGNHPVCNCVVKVIAAQTGIAVGRQNLNYAVADFDNGNIKGTAA